MAASFEPIQEAAARVLVTDIIENPAGKSLPSFLFFPDLIDFALSRRSEEHTSELQSQ